MGLLDGIIGSSFDDPRTAATLQLAQGLLSSPRVMQGLAGGLSGYQQTMAQAKQAKMMEEMRQMQMAQQKMQMEAAQRQQAQAQTDRDGMKFFSSPLTGANVNEASGIAGPTLQAAALIGQRPKLDPIAMQARGMSPDAIKDLFAVSQLGAPRAPDFKVVGNSLVQIGPDGVKEAYKAPEKPDTTSDLKEYLFAKQNEGFNGTFREWQIGAKRAGAPVNQTFVGTGKVGELETSYRKEFNSLPEVANYKMALPAFKAVESAAARDNAQADINLIYGLAKLYDPTSVVREGEYATIANSQSIPEWLKGQAQRLGGGGRLTPQTKSQILTEARARMQTHTDMYGQALDSYEGVIRRQGLDPQNVFIGFDKKPKGAAPVIPNIDPTAIDQELARRLGGG